MTECRLILDPPAAGAWNMAVDEALWESSGHTGRCCFRLYRWAEPTLSLGYFQAYDDRQQHLPSRSCAVVRRISGGGAIVHDAELTYSVVVPARYPAATRRQQLYEAVHDTIVEVLAGWGIDASIQPAGDSPQLAAQPFLCFERRAPGDVVVGAVKVAGSAQRRSQLAVLQHGSLLLARSQAAPELPGLEEIAGRRLAPDRLVAVWLERVSERLGLRWIEEGLSHNERHRASQLVAEKHATQGWIRSRGRGTPGDPFDTAMGPD
jgi:lipoate-protein ligase A